MVRENPRKAELAQPWQEFHGAIREIKARNAGLDPKEVQRIVDEAVWEVRAERAQTRGTKTAKGASG